MRPMPDLARCKANPKIFSFESCCHKVQATKKTLKFEPGQNNAFVASKTNNFLGSCYCTCIFLWKPKEW